jgi:F420-non-reducing hydrogenase small subunit
MSENGSEPQKLKVGVYWAASCGGCDVSILEIGPHLLELIEVADIVFWPCAADFKYSDLSAWPDEYADLFLWNGGIRNTEHVELAKLVRRKSKTLVAYGSCAAEGGIPALANLSDQEEMFDRAYNHNPSIDNPEQLRPALRTETRSGELALPKLTSRVFRLQDVVAVDYQIPGCPPQAHQVWGVLEAVVAGKVPARNDAVKVGCDAKSVCDECKREKRNVRIQQIRRPHEAIPEPDWCLLEQGFICMGRATRAGCGAACIKADMPCRGCYGTTGEAEDQGMAMVSAIGSLLAATTEEQAHAIVDQIVDPVGTFYRFSMGACHLKGRRAGEPVRS